MKKVVAIILSLVMIFAFVGCGNGEPAEGGEEAATYTLNLGTQFYDPVSTPELNAQGIALQYFADQVAEKSEGRITININWGSILGSSPECIEMMKLGDLDMVAGGATGSTDSRFSCILIPGVMDDLEMAREIYANPEGGLFQICKSIYADNGITLLSSDYGEFRELQNTKHEVITPEDCSDLLIRIYADDIVEAYWSGIANTTIMSMGEVYTGLQLGTIDGQEFCPPSTVSHGFHEVLKYWTDVRWQWQDSNSLLINSELYSSMSAEDQALIEECAWAASNYAMEMLDEDYEKALDAMEEAGVQLHYLTDEEREAWTAYTESVLPELEALVDAETYAKVKEVGDAYRASK
ncbi:MAG: TRAP transporter substrate-binding protein [Firmicutes bacterium]|nr:TRAP transporter substrate-binding protein [Bacillota bacterium]